MNDLALDPSETRKARPAAPRGAGRIALAAGLGLAGIGAFVGATSLMSGLLAPKPAAPVAARHAAADWPDLKDGLPALTGSTVADAPAPARFSLPPAEPPPLAQAALDAGPPRAAAPTPSAPPPPAILAAPAKAAAAAKPAASAARPAPTIENAPVIGPARQAGLVAPARSVAPLPPRAAETVRARTASTAFAALPPEPAATPERARPDALKAAMPAPPEPKAAAREETKPEGRTKPKPAQARKPAAAPTTVAAAAAPEEPEETEVFGIRMPTLAATGRKIGAGVEALGDAVKSLPDKF